MLGVPEPLHESLVSRDEMEPPGGGDRNFFAQRREAEKQAAIDEKVENLKADPTILGRIFGFGNVHIVTGSGVGLQVESLGMTAGAAAEVKEAPKGASRIISLLLGWITMKRDRTVMATDPADCLYGIKNPMGIYRLINELIDKEVGPTGSMHNSDLE